MDEITTAGAFDRHAGSLVGAPPQPGDTLGRFTLTAEIGRGGMGTVFRATDRVIGREVAIKVVGAAGVDRELARKFIAELKVLGRLRHPNIVQVHEFGDDRGLQFIVLELLVGETLAALIHKKRCGDFRSRVDLATQLAEALRHVHDAGVVHRDVKPSNVFVESSGRVKLLDFGISVLDPMATTGISTLAGTPEYMAPEQIARERPTRASDVYAFGVVLFELFSGTRAYRGTVEATLHEVVHDPFPIDALLESAPPRLVDLVQRATAKRPEDRPESFDEILTVLGEIAMLPGDALTLSPTPSAAAPAGQVRGPLAVLVVASLLLATVAAMTWQYIRSRPEPAARPPATAAPPLASRPLTIQIVTEQAGALPAAETIALARRDRFRLRLGADERGFAYLFSESADRSVMNVLFPSPTSNNASALLQTPRTQVPESSWFEPGPTPGIERIWVVWSSEPVAELEAVKRWANPRQRGLIQNLAERDGVAKLLRTSERRLRLGSGEAILESSGGTVAAALLISHE